MAVRKLLLDLALFLVFFFVCFVCGEGMFCCCCCFACVCVVFCLFGSFYFRLVTVSRVSVMTVFFFLAIIPPLDLQLTVLV